MRFEAAGKTPPFINGQIAAIAGVNESVLVTVLRRRGVGLVIQDADDHTTPDVVTARLSYLRLRKSAYCPKDLTSWTKLARAWVADGVDAYMYVKHEDNPDAPRIALDLASGLL